MNITEYADRIRVKTLWSSGGTKFAGEMIDEWLKENDHLVLDIIIPNQWYGVVIYSRKDKK